jgi:hypothetical protein
MLQKSLQYPVFARCQHLKNHSIISKYLHQPDYFSLYFISKPLKSCLWTFTSKRTHERQPKTVNMEQKQVIFLKFLALFYSRKIN